MFPKIDFLGIPTDTYALCIMLSFLVVFVAVLLLKPKEFPFRYILGGVIVFFVFATIGAILWNIFIHIPGHKGHDIGQIFRSAGLAYLGAPILAFFGLWIYLKCIKIPFLVVADYVAPFVMLERFIGRIGCLAYGCCYGIPSNLPWAYAFKSWGITNVVPRHPTQAYAIIYALPILMSSIYFYRKTKDARKIPAPEGWEKRSLEERKQLIREAPSAGIVFFYVFFWYGLLRFFNEFLRAEGSFIFGPIKTSHVTLSIFIITSAIGLFVIIKNSTSKNEILKALKGAFVRLVVWLVVSGTLLLSLLSMRGRFTLL